MSRNQKLLSILISVILMLACVPSLTPVAPVPTFDSNAPLTAIVQTSNAAATETQRFAPPTLTPTVTATRTPFPTETVSPTFLFFLPTITRTSTQVPAGSSGAQLECQVISQDPANNSAIAPSTTFTAKWVVANIGTYAWPSDNSDYRYNSGAKIHVQPIYDFENSVPSGRTTELTVNMKAPSASGVYSTSWRITIGKEQFCPMNLTIIVG
jgi:hypothetical protein